MQNDNREQAAGAQFRYACVLSVLTLLGAAACDEGEQVEAAAEIIRPVRVQQVFAAGGEQQRVFSGVAKPGIESRLSFKVGGSVQRLQVNVGDRVREGALIASLDPDDYRLQAQEAEASLERAEAEARNAAANYERTRALYENNNASRTDLDAARSAAESSTAAVASIAKQLELARRQLQYTRLRAPLDGEIATVDIELNENVRAGTAVVTLISGKTPEVQVNVPGVLIARVRQGDAVDVAFDAIPGEWFSAEVTEVGVGSGGVATSFPVTVRLQRAASRVRSGMAAEVTFSFQYGDGRERILVPPVAVAEDRDGRFVYVVEPGAEPGFGVIRRKAVEVGNLTGEGIEVFSGLLDGERVVTAGVSRINDGLKVRVLQ